MFSRCPFKLAVTIKKVTERKAKRDALLRSHPCFITIDQEHNHSTTCARALRELRVLPTVKASLEEYFEQGRCSLSVPASKSHPLDLNCFLLVLVVNGSMQSICSFYFTGQPNVSIILR